MFCISRCSPLQTLGFAVAKPVLMLPDRTAIPEWWHLPAGSQTLGDFRVSSAMETLGKIPAGAEGSNVGLWARGGAPHSPWILSALSVIGILGGGGVPAINALIRN